MPSLGLTPDAYQAPEESERDMGRDANIGRRDALAIPGWILIVYSVAAIVYAEHFRARSDFCADGSLVLIDGLCYTVWKLVLPLLLIGIGLAIGGAVGFKGTPERLEQRLRHGTPSHVMLGLLISFVVAPLALLFIQMARQNANDITYQVEFYGVPFKHTFVLAVVLLLAILFLALYVAAYVADIRRRNDFLAVAAGDLQPAPEVEEEPTFGDEDWPDSRDETDSEPATATSDVSDAPGAPRHYGYRMDAMDVIDIEGIGDAYAKKLAAAGVQTTARLALEDPDELAQRSGISAGYIRSWQQMAELTAVKGIGPQYAEALVRAGITSIAELRRRSAAALAKQVNDYLAGLDNNVLGTSITEARLKGWQEAAKGMRKTLRELPDN